MYQVLLCTCRGIILLIKSFASPHSRCRCRRGLLSLRGRRTKGREGEIECERDESAIVGRS